MRSRTRWLLAALALGTLVLTGCATDAPLDTLDPAGEKAESIDDLFIGVMWVATVIFILVFGAVAYIAYKYRVRRPGAEDVHYDGDYADEEFPEQVHGNFPLEIGWTIVPTIIMVAVAFFSLVTLLGLDDVDAAPEGSAHPDMEIVIVGQQWWWEYQYHLDGDLQTPPDLVSANEMIIPVERDIQLHVTSRDVIHSWWIPRLNGKRDAAPGRVHPWVIQANEIGRFAGSCTEFCGLSHAYMRMYTIVLDDADFAAWVEATMADREPLQEGDANYEGEQLFLQQCARCHVIHGVTSRDRDGDGEPEMDDLAMYGNIEEYRDHSDGTLGQGMHTEPGNLTAGAAPNLTHFATRTSYAGSFFDLYPDAQEITDSGGYLDIADNDFFRGQLEAWLRNPAAEKPNFAEGARGMPNLNLSEAQIDLLVDYLMSLD